jgi:hypothetical protein
MVKNTKIINDSVKIRGDDISMGTEMTMMLGLSEQICPLCHYSLSRRDLVVNKIGLVKDKQGMPELMIRCPKCKKEIEWEWLMN